MWITNSFRNQLNAGVLRAMVPLSLSTTQEGNIDRVNGTLVKVAISDQTICMAVQLVFEVLNPILTIPTGETCYRFAGVFNLGKVVLDLERKLIARVNMSKIHYLNGVTQSS